MRWLEGNYTLKDLRHQLTLTLALGLNTKSARPSGREGRIITPNLYRDVASPEDYTFDRNMS